MGTRGAMGVRIDGVDKIAYNHFDSYPCGLGDSIVADLKAMLSDPGIGGIRHLARALRLVDEGSEATAEEQAKFGRFMDGGVGSKKPEDWYVLLRELQGELKGTLQAGVMIDGHEFMADSLFCEWAYVVNLDESTFEVYRGFQHHAHKLGRYCDRQVPERQSGEYHPVALVGTFPLDAIPENWKDIVDPPEGK
jgi:hypothetical protein